MPLSIDAAGATEVVTHPVPGVAQIKLPYKNRWLSTYVLVGTHATAIVDTGPSWDDERLHVLNGLLEGAPTPHFLVITHLDADHRGAAGRILAHRPHTIVVAGAEDAPGLSDPVLTVTERYAGTPPPREALGPGVPVHVEVHETMVLNLGGKTRAWRIVKLSGHSAGHIGLFELERRTLIAGDALQRDGTPDRQGAVVLPPLYVSAQRYRRTLDMVTHMQPALLLEGHLGPTSGAHIEQAVELSRAWADGLASAVRELGLDIGAVASRMQVMQDADALAWTIEAELAVGRATGGGHPT